MLKLRSLGLKLGLGLLFVFTYDVTTKPSALSCVTIMLQDMVK